MQRRTIAAVLALGLAVYGTGLPQFVHAMTEHVAPHGAGGAAAISACHANTADGHLHHCSHHTPDDTRGVDAHPSTDHEDCPTCHLIASAAATALLPLLTTAIIAPLPGRAVPVEPDRVAPISVAPARMLRGPPALL